MKVALNILPLKTGHKSRGIGTYTASLLAALKEIPGIEIQEFMDLSEVKSADVVHYPFFDLFRRSLPIKKRFPTLVTVHDVTPLVFPEHYPPGIKGAVNHLIQVLSLKNVNAVITDSKASRRDIIKFLKVDPRKVFSIYLAESSSYKVVKDKNRLNKIKEKHNLPEHFCLFVGSTNWNKNLVNLTEACLAAGLDLVVVGKSFGKKDNLNHPELKSYKTFLEKFADSPRVYITGFVETEDLVAIYNLAEALLLPSFYEGFGLPILAAQACGTPVITSNTSSMPEVVGKGGILVDPYSVDSIRNSILEIKEDKKLREKLISSGFENVKKFSWQQTAQDTVEIYKYAIDPGD